VLALLEGDERMRFTLDGQMAPLDDYLEIRPEAAEQIRRFVGEGRLAIGPWQTLVDEFLVSGETIMRNLELGLARAKRFGVTMRVGYLPDSFGHIAQMPQILSSFGIETAVVWRGVPSEVDSHRFTWEAPDGSSVHAEYLPENGYSNAAYAFGGGDTLDAVVERLRPWFGDDPILGMVGTDHMPPVRDLPEQVPPGVRIGTLTEYVTDSLWLRATKAWRGELRSAARANLLPNVVSARIDIKQACARAERALERYAEPLQALYGGEWPQPFLDIAWSRLLQNAAHDSVCGCSADEVSAQVLVRYAEAEQIGTELTLRAVRRIAGRAAGDCTVIVNPSPRRRTDLVEVTGLGADALELPSGELLPTQRTSDGTLLALVSAPPLGWTTVRAASRATAVESPVTAGGTILRSESAELDVATLRLVDGGDLGDSYNYAPPDGDVLVDEPVDSSVHVLEAGPLRARLLLRRTYRWPRWLDGTSRSRETADVPVELLAELRAGEPFVRIRIAFDNECDDHRVRVYVPLVTATDRTRAEGQFAVVERPRLQEAGFGEEGLGAYPASAFVAAGGVALLFEHVAEYELVGERELAVTALRSVGLVSRAANPYRRVNAGPELPIPAAQLHGPQTFSFAWCADVEHVLEHAEQYRHPFLTSPGGAGDLREQPGPELTGAMLSSLRRRNGALEARVVNETDAATTARFGAARADLRPWEIRSLTL
jgi:Glycosyl hydrolases family 38 N-terminal domain/Alpha mannosidase middle domain/Glycosyl hydrolases family 38 C-terminal domain